MFRTFSIQNWNSISKDKYQSRLSDFKFKGFNLFFKKVEYQNLSVTDENISLEYKIHWNIIFWLLFIIAALATTIVLFRFIKRWSIIIPIIDLILTRLIVSTCHSKVINELYNRSK